MCNSGVGGLPLPEVNTENFQIAVRSVSNTSTAFQV